MTFLMMILEVVCYFLLLYVLVIYHDAEVMKINIDVRLTMWYSRKARWTSGLFFMQLNLCQKKSGYSFCMIRANDLFRTLAEVELCVQRLHWHVQSANSVITILQRRRRPILTEWRSRSIVDSAGLIHCTKKQNK